MSKLESSLFIQDINIDYQKAYYLASKAKKIEKVMAGVWVDASLGPDERRAVLLRNAARIATRAYSQAHLAGSSAFHRGAVEGQLLLGIPYHQKSVDVGGAFTIHFQRSDLDVSANRELEIVEIDDDFGRATVRSMADELLIIKNFQRRAGRPEATYLKLADLAEVVERAIRKCGGSEQLLKRLDALISHHGAHNFRDAICSLVKQSAGYAQELKPHKSFDVYWHRDQIARLTHDGHIWSFDYEKGVEVQLSVQERRGKRLPPSFLASILPEMGPQADGPMEERLYGFENGNRYISNITVLPQGGKKPEIIVDVLDGELPDFTSKHLTFTGTVEKSLLRTTQDDALLNDMQDSPSMPRISGMQVKLAVHLDSKGELSAAADKSFTHIMKLAPGASTLSTLGAMEWFSLSIARMSGMNVEHFALVELDGRGPALVVERFDVRRDFNDRRLILTEDFWSVAGMQVNKQKYAGELLDVADVLNKHSTSQHEDARALLQQAIFSWLTVNGDMHLKNLLLLKTSKDTGKGFDTVRLSPAFDILCTGVYAGYAKSAAIGLCGTRNHTLAGFRALGKKLDMKVEEVDATVEFLSSAVPMWSLRIRNNLPEAIKRHSESMAHIELASKLFEGRCQLMLGELNSASKRRSKKSPDEEAAEAVAHFSAENLEPSTDHIEAEKRRSWVPESKNDKPKPGLRMS